MLFNFFPGQCPPLRGLLANGFERVSLRQLSATLASFASTIPSLEVAGLRHRSPRLEISAPMPDRFAAHQLEPFIELGTNFFIFSFHFSHELGTKWFSFPFLFLA